MDKELEDQFYEQVAREIAANNYQPAPMARAVEKSAGNADLAKSLYVTFRVEQIVRDFKQEIRRKQLEAEQNVVAANLQATARAKALAEENIRQQKSDQLRQQLETEVFAKQAAKMAAKREAERTAERAAERAAADERRQAVFKRKQKEAAERTVARQKAWNDLMTRVRPYLIEMGVITDPGTPLPEELQRSASSWDVHFGSLLTDLSRTGFVRRGRLRIDNGTIILDGWKLSNKALRVVIGIVLACALMLVFRSLDERGGIDVRMAAWMRPFLAVSFLEYLQQVVGPNVPFPAIWNIKGLLCFGISICIAGYISSYHLALPGSGTFVPVTRPKCRGRCLTMKIRPPESQKARHVCLRFRSHLDARVFQSHFEQPT